MRFPIPIKKLNDVMVVISGALIAVIAIFAVIEVVARRFLMSPTTWTLNVSQYLLIWAILLASASAFQHKAHVSVDFIRVALARRFGLVVGRVLAVISYLASLVYIVVLGWKTVNLIKGALKTDQLTQGTIQIPSIYLYAAMLVGAVLMAVSVVSIILDLLSGSTEYISEEEWQ